MLPSRWRALPRVRTPRVVAARDSIPARNLEPPPAADNDGHRGCAAADTVSNLTKMVAYQIESDLVRAIAPL